MKQNLLPAAGLLMSFLLGSCTREPQVKATTNAQETTTFPEVISFSLFTNGKTEIEYAESGQQHKVQWQGSNITSVFIDGEKMPEETHKMYKVTAEKILQQIKAGQEKKEKGLTPPKAKGLEAGKDRIEVVDLFPNDRKTNGTGGQN